MAGFNPCCCMSLQRGTIILAIIDAVMNGILLGILILAFVGAILIDPEDPKYDITQSEKTQLIIYCVLAIIVAFCQICLAVFLRRSAKENNYHGLRRWLIITIVLFAFAIINVALRTHAGTSALDLSTSIIGILYRLYVMFVVLRFMKEISSGGTNGSGAVNHNYNEYS